ncbi:hypothetical protein Taro_042604 [Colocasia esculenta]|uniref:VQ domain-containing protein n=1 Tax=Colocasia esculenta TaxID=4460 RepID=A0A843WYW7_COLES|nr:hypothetical protein [Colocasia esculenta]
MGNPGKLQEKESPTVQSSPRASPGSNGNGGGGGGGATPAAPPLTPKIIPRSETNPYPTTFVQADTSSFKQVVQMLTGSADTAAKRHQAAAAEVAAPPARSPIAQAKTGPKRPAFKLYERRHSSFKNLRINPLVPELLGGVAAAGFSPRQQQPEVLSPSVLDFPSLTLSPVTPLIPDPFTRPPHPSSPAGLLAEERGIAEKGFYLHPSPRGADPPKLLPLFPVASPRVSSASPSSTTASP